MHACIQSHTQTSSKGFGNETSLQIIFASYSEKATFSYSINRSRILSESSVNRRVLYIYGIVLSLSFIIM